MLAYILLSFMSVSKTFNLPPGLLSSVCYVESHHKTDAMHAHDGGTSSVGICQIKLETAKTIGFRGTEAQLREPRINIFYAGKYLRKQLDRYDQNIPIAIAAYNAGSLLPSDTGDGPVNAHYVKQVLNAWAEGH